MSPRSGLGNPLARDVTGTTTLGGTHHRRTWEVPLMTVDVARVNDVLADAVVDDREAGIYRANRRIFTDEELFELEMTHIFEGNWVYLAHESQVANPGDYFTTYIGRQ